MRIRVTTSLDAENIRELHMEAFPVGEGEVVSELAGNLLAEETQPRIISLVAEVEDSVVAHIVFSPVEIDGNEEVKAYILAPLAVKSDYQKRRIGSALIEYGQQALTEMGINILFVYGDPKFYCRFGFSKNTAAPYAAPYPLEYPFAWQATILNEADFAKTPTKIACVASLCDPELW